jgi:hypothetical protein
LNGREHNQANGGRRDGEVDEEQFYVKFLPKAINELDLGGEFFSFILKTLIEGRFDYNYLDLILTRLRRFFNRKIDNRIKPISTIRK